MVGGLFACGLTHTAVVPLDLIKTRRQVDSNLYKSLGQGFSVIAKNEGLGGLTRGWAPTLIGYSFQGVGKFGFYEIFKDLYAKVMGDKVHDYKVIGYAVSSASAEVIADFFLCPWEATRVRIQTSPTGTFPTQLIPAMKKIIENEGTQGLYKGLGPLWARQIPYTIAKFVFFEKIVELFYKNILTSKPKSEYSKSTQLGVTFASGYLAGIICAIVSHPADTMVSKLNSIKSEGSLGQNVSKIYSEIGFNGLWRGLMTRIVMIGTLTGL